MVFKGKKLRIKMKLDKIVSAQKRPTNSKEGL
jgi:hypothetical protein